MKPFHYSGVDLLIDERNKKIIVNPKGSRFYFVECEDQEKIFRDASLNYDVTQERYEIQGEQTIYSEHHDLGLSYENLLCLHPAELIKRKSFFGIVWYSVSGILKREVRSRYLCKHKEYRIYERTEFLSQSIEEV
jgi:hypothetical protein